jgi:hypothetical protein
MLAYLQRRSDVDSRRIGLFGFSMGAQIGIRTRIIFVACMTLATVLVWDLRLLLIPFGLTLAQS